MIKVAFYKSSSGDWTDSLIAFATASWAERISGAWRENHSHCEIILPSTNTMFSSSGRDKGVRFKPFPGGKYWDIIELPSLPEELVLLQASKYVGLDYDFSGVIGFVVPYVHQDQAQWFCSELLVKVLNDLGALPSTTVASSTSPEDLYRIVLKLLEK